MTTTTTWLQPVIGAQRNGETVPPPVLEPIFNELAHRWESAGRLVPGRYDEEWATLTDPYSWRHHTDLNRSRHAWVREPGSRYGL